MQKRSSALTPLQPEQRWTRHLLHTLPPGILDHVLRFLPTAGLVLAGSACRHLQEARGAIIAVLGYTAANDGLRTAYLLEAVLGASSESVSRVMRHLVRGEGQWVLWGDDVGLSTFKVLADLWSGAGMVDLRLAGTTSNLFEMDEGIGAAPSPMLRDPAGRFAHTCYADEVAAALATRDVLPAAADAHGSLCGRCGATEELLFTADLPARRNLCAPCLDTTFLTRHRFFARHGGAYFLDVKGPYSIPERLLGTRGTRVGLLFSGGAQHSAFGLEFWANPPLLGPGGLWATQEAGESVPPCAWEIAIKSCGYRGP